MRSIGIRAEPRAVTFAIYDSEQTDSVNIDVIKVPQSLRLPEALRHVRCNIIDVMRESRVEIACIRVAESISLNISLERISLEAIIQEASASSIVRMYKVYRLSTMARAATAISGNQISQSECKAAIEDGTISLHPEWGNLKPVERECLLSAMGGVQ